MINDSKGARRIKVTKDGPYAVSGNVPLGEEDIVVGSDGEPCRWEKGESYPNKESYSLCRCGASKAKPYCDGSHVEAAFDGTETAGHGPYLENVERTVGPGIDLTYSQEFCACVRFCHGGKGAWSYAEASGDPEARARAVEEACACPSGSLVAWDKTTGAAIEPACEPGISLIEDPRRGVSGPLWVKGAIPIESADGVEYERRNRVTLCRCGRSRNKPFCDGSHLDSALRSKP
ncbi:MAG: CDGSH iron-sulfur domain-containing protein [Candidatus Aminicenantales bacterium]